MSTIDINSELAFHDGNHLVAGFAGSMLRLRNCATGEYSTIHIGEVASRLIEPPVHHRVDPSSIESRTKEETKELHDNAAHLEEMMFGTRRDDPALPPRPQYDPAITSLNQRQDAKVKELKELGMPASTATLKRRRRAYETGGLAGLIDGRTTRAESPLDRADQRVIDTMTHLIGSETSESTGTGKRLHAKLRAELLRAYPGEAVPVPSEATLYRYQGYLTKGKYTTGSSQTRRTAANRPKRPFGTARLMRPGQEVQIDSSPWDILILGEDGKPARAQLTIMIDVATRSIIAVSVRLIGTKGVDHAFLLAQCMVPRPLRPGNQDLWRLTARRMPWVDLTPEEERAKLDQTVPFIYPERIMMDNGADYRSKVFEAACRKFGVTLTYAAPHTPTDKAIVERTFHSVKTLFAQDLPGFKGGSVAERGDRIEKGVLLDVVTLAERFSEWVARVWQNRPHDNLRDPMYPSVKLTPNEMYNASFDFAAQLPLPLTAEDYIELLPVQWRVVHPAGIQYNHVFYDSPELQPFRDMPSNNKKHDNKWEVRVNPYDPRMVWVRHPDNHWIECLWRDETTYRQPFADQILQAATELAGTRTGADKKELEQLSADIKARTAKTAITVEKAEARAKDAKVLAELQNTAFPAQAPTTRIPATHPLGDDDTEYEDETEEIDFAALGDDEGNIR
jgi:putative transposase